MNRALYLRLCDQTSFGESCWLWMGRANELGYGRISVGRKEYFAHRVAFELASGPIPRGMCVLHSCDTPGCVRPAHLRLGTQADNMRDMAAKGRSTRGEWNVKAKVGPDDVVQMRKLYAQYTQAELGAMYGISQVQVSHIVTRKHWKHITEGL